MRAFNNLLALSSCYDIDLLIFHFGWRKPPAPHPEIIKICSNIFINVPHPISDYQYLFNSIRQRILLKIFRSLKFRTTDAYPWLTPHREGNLQHYFRGKHFHTIHIFRLMMYPVFEVISKVLSYGHLQIDLDDIDSEKLTQIAKLYLENSNYPLAKLLERSAVAHQKLERTILPTAEQVFVCSQQDRVKIKTLYGCLQVTVLPNVYPEIGGNEREPDAGKFRFLFVGALDSEPNADAIRYFCNHILPFLRKEATLDFELQIIGYGKLSGKTQKIIAQQPEIKLLGEVDDVGPFYLATDVAIAPVRAGSGTRMKILEAFAWQVPVVSTSKGIEGLEATHDAHALIADSPLDFARQCTRLMTDPSLRDKLVRNAKYLVQTKYSPVRLTEILCAEKQT